MPSFYPVPYLLAFGLLVVMGCSISPAAQPTATSPNQPPAYDTIDLEDRILREVNRVRRDAGREPLELDPRLAEIARGHSRDMRDRDFIAHRNPDGLAPGGRASRAGYRFLEFGENLFRGRLYDILTRSGGDSQTRTFYRWHTPKALAELVAQLWLESPSHRENMLAGRYDHGGVGVVIGVDHYVSVTLNLSAY